MYRIILAATLLLSLSALPAYADKAPTLRILTASGFGCKAVDNGILHCSNPDTKDEYDCTPKPDAPCVGSPPAPQEVHGGGKPLGAIKLQGNFTRVHG